MPPCASTTALVEGCRQRVPMAASRLARYIQDAETEPLVAGDNQKKCESTSHQKFRYQIRRYDLSKRSESSQGVALFLKVTE